MTSTRLPGKVLIDVAGKTLLDHHLDRLATADLPIFVATTTNDSDDPIVEAASRRSIDVHRGSEHDVLARFAGLVEKFGLTTVVRVTSDCPLIDGRVVADAVTLQAAGGNPWRYASNAFPRTFPRGMDVEVFSAEALLDAAANAGDPHQREHVTPYLYENGSGRMELVNLARKRDASAYRITLDTADDLTLIRALFEEYDAAALDCDALVALLDEHPELVSINAHVEQKKLGD